MKDERTTTDRDGWPILIGRSRVTLHAYGEVSSPFGPRLPSFSHRYSGLVIDADVDRGTITIRDDSNWNMRTGFAALARVKRQSKKTREREHARIEKALTKRRNARRKTK